MATVTTDSIGSPLVLHFGPALNRLSDEEFFEFCQLLRAKMHEYIAFGVRLGWLIDPTNRRIEIYRPGKKPQTVKAPRTISGDPELPGFVLQLERIWPA